MGCLSNCVLKIFYIIFFELLMMIMFFFLVFFLFEMVMLLLSEVILLIDIFVFNILFISELVYFERSGFVIRIFVS